MRQQNGFTLLEVMVAVSIFMLVGLGAWRIMNTVTTAREVTDQQSEQLGELQRAMLLIGRDLRQIADRSIRDALTERQPTVVADYLGRYPLEFTRRGWRNPLERERSNLQRVAYEVREGQLLRHYWWSLDRAPEQTPRSQVLLTQGIQELQVRFLDGENGWLEAWPPELEAEPLERWQYPPPQAIELQLQTEQFGAVRRLYEVPGA